jgi:glutaredoxin
MQGGLPWAPWALAAALIGVAGCTRAPPPAPSESAPPPAIEVSAARTDLVFSYPQDGGRRFATATRVEDVPVEARRQVVVTDLSLSPEVRQAGKYVYLADLTAPRDDGTFPVGLASRYGFEVSATATTSVAAPRGARQVIVYSASWCGVCKKAKRVLTAWGVPFEEKDIEASRAAQRELAEKAAARGFQPGGVPVIDVDGHILQGLDERSLRQILVAEGYLPKG